MADSTLFDVDAAQIFAKLHLAGLQAVAIPNGDFIVNTGVKNDDPKAKPDNPGKVTFDITGREYEVGYVTDIEYHKAYRLNAAVEKLKKLLEDLDGNSSKIDMSSSDPKVKKQREELEELKKSLQLMLGSKLKSKIESVDDIGDVETAVEEVAKADEEAYSKVVEDAKSKATKALQSYMENFAGKDNVSSIADPMMVCISEKAKDSNDPSVNDMFKIPSASDQELEKLAAQFKAQYTKDPAKDNCKQKVCFKVGYTLNVDK